ncbi:MAG: NUDIX domain-containing protein [Erysipelotrichaceae bacterium]|jgi:8-oxo-dGTP diphosphatase
MGKIIRIENSDITDVLKSTTRQYFVGNLSRPQQITFIRDDRLEIGISSYSDGQSETAHVHDVATEYQYIISGWTEYMNVETGEIYEFKKGDFYAIEPDTSYAQRVAAGTTLLFIKVPSINDKKTVVISDEQLVWLEEKMRVLKKEYYFQNEAPEANSIKPATEIAVINSKHELLMLKPKDLNQWMLPGCTMKCGESIIECAIRGVKEKSGLDIRVRDVIGIYTNPDIRFVYSDGEVRQEFIMLYNGELLNNDVTAESDIFEFKWVSLESLSELSQTDSQKIRSADILAYIEKGTRKLI